MARFTCDVCGYTKAAPDEWLYRKAICPKCKGKSVIVEDEIQIAEEGDFDETQTFAYKGDYLGMSLALFLKRHDDVGSQEFSIISSKSTAPQDYKRHGFEDWTRGTDRIVNFCAYGTRLTIVDAPLKHGVFTFLDHKLALISLTLANPSIETYTTVLPALHGALNDPTETSGVGGISVTTWVRPLGEMCLMHSIHGPELQVRYINQETLADFNTLRSRLTASRDL